MSLKSGIDRADEVFLFLKCQNIFFQELKMGKSRYYCNYCDTSFPDSREGRKKHNTGLVHQKLKDAHYKQFAGD